MRLQTDQEFRQRNIEELNKKFNNKMYSSHLRGGKAFVAEQKIRELKKILLRSKRIAKFKGKRIKPNKLIKKQCLIQIMHGLQNTDIHESKLKKKHLILRQ